MITIMYVWANIMNLLCYDSCKTIEFRFLRPTFNMHKILLWMYLFNAILIYSENIAKSTNALNERYLIRRLKGDFTGIKGILRSVYPSSLAEYLISEFQKLACLVVNQEHNGDFIGANTEAENLFMNPDDII